MASKRKKLGFFHLRKILFTGIMLCVSVIFFLSVLHDGYDGYPRNQ